MSNTIKKTEDPKEIIENIKLLSDKLNLERKKKKLALLNSVAGKVIFDKNKTPLEIQKEMRDEWD